MYIIGHTSHGSPSGPLLLPKVHESLGAAIQRVSLLAQCAVIHRQDCTDASPVQKTTLQICLGFQSDLEILQVIYIQNIKYSS